MKLGHIAEDQFDMLRNMVTIISTKGKGSTKHIIRKTEAEFRFLCMAHSYIIFNLDEMFKRYNYLINIPSRDLEKEDIITILYGVEEVVLCLQRNPFERLQSTLDGWLGRLMELRFGVADVIVVIRCIRSMINNSVFSDNQIARGYISENLPKNLIKLTEILLRSNSGRDYSQAIYFYGTCAGNNFDAAIPKNVEDLIARNIRRITSDDEINLVPIMHIAHGVFKLAQFTDKHFFTTENKNLIKKMQSDVGRYLENGDYDGLKTIFATGLAFTSLCYVAGLDHPVSLMKSIFAIANKYKDHQLKPFVRSLHRVCGYINMLKDVDGDLKITADLFYKRTKHLLENKKPTSSDCHEKVVRKLSKVLNMSRVNISNEVYCYGYWVDLVVEDSKHHKQYSFEIAGQFHYDKHHQLTKAEMLRAEIIKAAGYNQMRYIDVTIIGNKDLDTEIKQSLRGLSKGMLDEHAVKLLASNKTSFFPKGKKRADQPSELDTGDDNKKSKTDSGSCTKTH